MGRWVVELDGPSCLQQVGHLQRAVAPAAARFFMASHVPPHCHRAGPWANLKAQPRLDALSEAGTALVARFIAGRHVLARHFVYIFLLPIIHL